MKIDEIGNGKKEKFHEKKGKKVLTKTQTCINRGFAKIAKKYYILYKEKIFDTIFSRQEKLNML